MPNYIAWLRDKVGHDPIQLNFAAACIVTNDGVLLQHRADDGHWGLPGGAIELGESAEEAAKREVAEETGLHVTVTDLLGIYTKYQHTYPNGDVVQPITVFFLCSPTAGTLNTLDPETLDLQYHPLDNLPPLTNQQHQDALNDLRNGQTGTYN